MTTPDQAAARLFSGHICQVRRRLAMFGPKRTNLVALLVTLLLLDLDVDERRQVLSRFQRRSAKRGMIH